MKCKVCGAESGKYPLCRECYRKKEAGEIIKCPVCQQWHYADMPCPDGQDKPAGQFLYERKFSLVTRTEMEFLNCIKEVLPDQYLIQPQVNLASFIVRTDEARFRSELYRNVDFLITDLSYRPLVVIEINDQTHLAEDRRERDRKVAWICEEAGIPVVRFWTSYGVNREYIEKKITETLAALPAERVHHFVKETEQEPLIYSAQASGTVGEPGAASGTGTEPGAAAGQEPAAGREAGERQEQAGSGKKGCYIATCVYGSYDCPQVWTLRRFRDDYLEQSRPGRWLVRLYYGVSPALVRLFGDKKGFRTLGRKCLDVLIRRLRRRGIEDTPYTDSE